MKNVKQFQDYIVQDVIKEESKNTSLELKDWDKAVRNAATAYFQSKLKA